jgi:hypothetical protein
VLADANGTENIMISPFSITSALSMTLNGAAGETFEAMKKTLGLEGKTLVQINKTYLKLMTEMIPVDKSVVLDIANSVWVDKQLNVKQPFITDLQTFYKGEARDIDVTDPDAVNIVNDWIALKTQDKITEMLAGDTILSVNQETMRIETDVVKQIDSVRHKDIVHISFSDLTQNNNTFDHPYYVKDKGWCSYKPSETLQKYNLKTKQLQIGDTCFKYKNNKLIEIQIKNISENSGEVMTYNISRLERNKTYFANGILVSNENN